MNISMLDKRECCMPIAKTCALFQPLNCNFVLECLSIVFEMLDILKRQCL